MDGFLPSSFSPLTSPRTVLVFGVFDGVHEGHRALFRQAKAHGERLVVAVAQDTIVERLKGKLPQHAIGERIALLRQEPLVDEAIPGDTELGAYTAVTEHRPAVVVLGYDQKALGEDLGLTARQRGWDFGIITADAHEPETYHNSLLKK